LTWGLLYSSVPARLIEIDTINLHQHIKISALAAPNLAGAKAKI
jgi:hypothetical protein